jgi:hypothetical protein
MKALFKALICFQIISVSLFAEDTSSYSFDLSELDIKPYEISANIDFYPSLKLNADASYLSDTYAAKAEARLQYKWEKLTVFLSGMIASSYVRIDDTITYDGKIYQGYLKFSPITSMSISIGKQALRWGKGYLYNPVAFIARPKDINDIDASFEGYWLLSGEIIKSFSRKLSTIATTFALVPVIGKINEGYMQDSSMVAVAQCYALFYDTDIDIYLSADLRSNFKTGLDFSRNITPSLEVHAEAVFTSNDSITLSGVAGGRYLTPFNTTIIAEYLYMSGGQFLMTDYIYVKASHPEPFSLVYFTPSIFSLVNVGDKSIMMGTELSYTRFDHFLFQLKYSTLTGDSRSEFGMKLVKHRIELKARLII